ncbi:stage II sporulation protein D [Oceanobacillus sp. CAU 1775]
MDNNNQRLKTKRNPFSSKRTHSKVLQSKAYQKKKPVTFPRRQRSYQIPAVILSFFSLLFLIVAIPSMIVLFFGNAPQEPFQSAEDRTLDMNDEAISVAVMRTKADKVEDIPLENYIVGVVAAEMPADFDMEAMKAQALAARTYAVSRILGGDQTDDYDLTDTIQHQVYKNDAELQQLWGDAYEKNIAKIREAVEATAGEIITYNDKPITPAYFSMSNGYTENSEDYWENEVAYLRSVESPWDLNQPKLVNQETFTMEELGKLLEVDLTDTPDLLISRKPSGRVEQLQINGEAFTGREVREKLGLRSSDFSIKQNNTHYIFTTKGNGHGIGMSQYGADSMAKAGQTYQEILKHYYQNIEINKINDTVPALASK